MRFGKYIAKTFLVFAASGAGTAFGVSMVTLGAIAASKKLWDFNTGATVIENEEKTEDSK